MASVIDFRSDGPNYVSPQVFLLLQVTLCGGEFRIGYKPATVVTMPIPWPKADAMSTSLERRPDQIAP